jgi:hypothetical protein
MQRTDKLLAKVVETRCSVRGGAIHVEDPTVLAPKALRAARRLEKDVAREIARGRRG